MMLWLWVALAWAGAGGDEAGVNLLPIWVSAGISLLVTIMSALLGRNVAAADARMGEFARRLDSLEHRHAGTREEMARRSDLAELRSEVHALGSRIDGQMQHMHGQMGEIKTLLIRLGEGR